MDDIEKRAIIKFLTREKITPKNIHDRMIRVFGECSVSYAAVKKWASLFKSGRESLEDDPRSGRPKSVTTPETVSEILDFIKEDRRMSVEKIANLMGISHGTVWKIIHEELDMKKISARWVPKTLRNDEKLIRVTLAKQFLKNYQKNGMNFGKKLSRVTKRGYIIMYLKVRGTPGSGPDRGKNAPEWQKPKDLSEKLWQPFFGTIMELFLWIMSHVAKQ